MSNSEVKENFIVLRVKGPKFIMKKPIVRRANKKETWQNFLQNSCGLKQVSKKAGFFVKTVLPETRRRRSDGEHYGWTAEMDEKIGTFIGRFWQRRNKNTVILYCRLPVRSEGGRVGLMALSPMPMSSSPALGQEPEEIGDDDDYVRRVTLEKMQICSSESEDSEPETDDNSEEPVNPKTEPESDFETEYEENEEMSFGSSDLFAEGQDDDDDGGNGNATGQDNILILFDSSDPPEEVPAKNNENREEGNGNGESGDDVNRGASTSASAQEDDEKPSTSSQCPMPASSTKDVAKKELERCSNGYLSKIKQELEDLKARNMWEGIEDKSPLAYRLLEDLFKV